MSKLFLCDGESPLLDYLPVKSHNFSNLSHITAVNLQLGADQKYVQLSGPSGSSRVFRVLALG